VLSKAESLKEEPLAAQVSNHLSRKVRRYRFLVSRSQAARNTADVIKINAIGADPEYIYPVADLPYFRTRHEPWT